MSQWLAPAHLALTLVIIVWDVVLAGSIARVRQASKPFATITGLAGLLLIPAVIVAVATTTVITGRAVSAIEWIWPAVVLLFAVQSVYAVFRRLVNPLWGYPIAFYNVLLAAAALARFFAAHGVDLPHPLLVIMAAQVDALALVTTDAAMTSPFFLHVPMVSPAFPALRPLTAGFRLAMSVVAIAWFGLIVAEMPRADIALASYDSHAADRLRERPAGFAVGLKMFPDVFSPPSSASVSMDVETADSLRVNVASVVFVPGASRLAIDSVARALALMRRDSLFVIATVGYRGKLLPELSPGSLDVNERLATIRRILTRLRPDILLPAEDPYGIGARIVGRLPVATWQAYFTRAAAVVREVRPRTRVALSAAAFDSRDSTLFAWAASAASPINIVGFTFYPDRLGARAMDARFRAADRWMRALPQEKPYWVFGAGGYPLAHGERSQDRAVWASLAWATAHAPVRGLVVVEANDYGTSMGVRAPDGRFRRVASTIRRAVRGLRESAAQGTPAAPTAP